MRLQLTFSIDHTNRFLPINYQYHLCAWVYKSLQMGNDEYSRFLHNKGYGNENKKFKLFNFGMLDIRPFVLNKEREELEVLGEEVSLPISFLLPEMAQHFINGVNQNAEIFIGDKGRGIKMKLKSIQVLPAPLMMRNMHYKLISPCCVSRPALGNERYSQYLSPNDTEYVTRLVANLKSRYTVSQNVFSMAGDHDDELSEHIEIKMTSNKYISKLISIKGQSEKPIKLRGWLFSCEVSAPVEVQEVIWNTGLGEKCSMGFGMVDLA